MFLLNQRNHSIFPVMTYEVICIHACSPLGYSCIWIISTKKISVVFYYLALMGLPVFHAPIKYFLVFC